MATHELANSRFNLVSWFRWAKYAQQLHRRPERGRHSFMASSSDDDHKPLGSCSEGPRVSFSIWPKEARRALELGK